MDSTVPKRQRNLTEKDAMEAARLKAIWERKKRDLGLTQEKLAVLMGFQTQGSVSQYFNGRIAMNNEVLLKFAHHLKFDPREVRPEIMDDLPALLSQESGGIDAETITFARKYARLPDEDREMLKNLLDKLGQAAR